MQLLPAKRPLVILGAGPTKRYGVEIADQLKCECWGINYMIDPQVTLMFQMHGDQYIRSRFLDHYKIFPPKVPIVMHHRWRELPTSIPFPLRQYAETFGLQDRWFVDTHLKGDNSRGLMPRGPYASCSMPYMLALAAILGVYDVIYMYGVDFYQELRHEAEYERPCTEWHMGFLQARGVRFVVPENCRLGCTENNPRMLYGVEWNPALSLDEMEKAIKVDEKQMGVYHGENTHEARQAAAPAAAAGG